MFKIGLRPFKAFYSARIAEVHVVLVLLVVVSLLGTLPPFINWFNFDAQSVAQGQYWRPFTAWFSHLNFRHWLLNQWGLLMMLFLLPARLKRIDWLALFVIWLSCSVLLWNSSYVNYFGLSGVLYGWIVFAAWLTPFYSRWFVWLVIGAISVKVFSENGLPLLPQSSWVGDFIGSSVAYRSHLWGLLSGLVAIVTHCVWRQSP